MKRIGGWFVDYPLLASVFLLALVGVHYFLAGMWPVLNVAHTLATSQKVEPREALMSLALGVASVAALVGGFAGVVVVFGLGTENDRFRLLRQSGKRRLRANWISVVLSSLAAAFGSVVAAAIVIGFGAEIGLWVLEVFLLFAAHGAVRLTALLAGLAKIVDSTDEDNQRQAETVETGTLLPELGKLDG